MKILFKIVSTKDVKHLAEQNKVYKFIAATGKCEEMSLTKDEYLYVSMSKTHGAVIDTDCLKMFYWNIAISDYAYYRLCEHLDYEELKNNWQEYELDEDMANSFIKNISSSIQVDEYVLRTSYDTGNNIDTTLSNGYSNESFYNYDKKNDIYLQDIFRVESEGIIEQIVDLFAEIEKLLCNSNKY